MKKKRVIYLLAGLLLGMTACGKEPEQENVAVWKPTIIAAVTATPTVTIAPTEAATPVPTEVPIRTITPIPTPTPTPTSTPTPTATSMPTPTVTVVPEAEPIIVPVMPDMSLSEKIPVISVLTEDGQPIVSRNEYLNCTVSVYNVEENYALSEQAGGIRVRGNSSAYYGNKNKVLTEEVPYRIKFEKKTNLLGLNEGAECKSWVLLRGNQGLVRDDIAFRFGRTLLKDISFCSDAQLVHLYVNQEFKGVFLLCEQSQVNKHRVDIYEPKAEEKQVEIGYLLEIDNYANGSEHPCFKMDYEKAEVTDIEGVTERFTSSFYSIKSDVTSEEQTEFISKYMNDLFELIYEACENGTYLTFDENYQLVEAEFDNAKDTVAAVLNLESVVSSYILEEIMHDMDCGEGSFFMCIDFSEGSKYPKLTFTCPWDYNWTCTGKAKGQYYAAAFNDPSFVEKYEDRSNPWFILLMGQDWFVDMVKEKWTQVQREGALAACIQEEREYIKKYKSDLNRKNAISTDTGHAVLDWMEDRIEWLDEEWLIAE